jgi:hypothetical protein
MRWDWGVIADILDSSLDEKRLRYGYMCICTLYMHVNMYTNILHVCIYSYLSICIDECTYICIYI